MDNLKSEISSFFALVLRQKYITRWGLMRNAMPENLAQHSSECAVIAHALATIGNTVFGRNYDVGKITVMALFHDVPEVFTGDMPTPVKYANEKIRKQFGEIEKQSTEGLLSKLPENIREEYRNIFEAMETDEESERILKSADRLCAYIKCLEEEKYGNSEFSSAKISVENKLTENAGEETKYFMEHFLPAFGLTLDEQQNL